MGTGREGFWELPWVRRALRLIPSQGEAYKWGTKSGGLES